jgi:hypothetical protein
MIAGDKSAFHWKSQLRRLPSTAFRQFPDSSSGLEVEGSRKISCCFPRGTMPSFL